MRTRPAKKPGTGVPAPDSGIRLVFLVGFMGAGKSSVGRAVARRLHWAFADLDAHIEARENRAIEEIFRQSGEPGFRRIEHSALQDLLSGTEIPGRVIALGGGAYAQARTAALVKKSGGTVFFLDAPVKELYRRCNAQNLERPLLGDWRQFRGLYSARKPFYLKGTRHIGTGGKDVETVAAEVISSLRLGGSGENG